MGHWAPSLPARTSTYPLFSRYPKLFLGHKLRKKTRAHNNAVDKTHRIRRFDNHGFRRLYSYQSLAGSIEPPPQPPTKTSLHLWRKLLLGGRLLEFLLLICRGVPEVSAIPPAQSSILKFWLNRGPLPSVQSGRIAMLVSGSPRRLLLGVTSCG